jgi:peroxiredoxin
MPTPSTMLPLGTQAPDFTLIDTRTEKMVSLKDARSEIGTVIIFSCNHCPYVKHIQKKLVEVVEQYQQKGISFLAISANDIENYPADSPAKMQEEAEQSHFTFPYLFDETQEVARAYEAACTPDFFLFDADLKCVYRGRFDAATPGNDSPVTGHDLTAALDNLLAKKAINPHQFPSVGCNIKWKQN